MSKFVGTAEQIAAERQAIVDEALTWIGTPFHHCAGVKGVGCDCAHLVWRVAQARGYVPGDEEPPPYKPQWFLHSSQKRFLEALQRHGARRTEVAGAGDIAMYNFGQHAAHAAFLVDSRCLVHAFMPVGRVTIGDRRELAPVLDSYWTVF